MSSSATGLDAVTREVMRIEEDTLHSCKRHFKAAARRVGAHLWRRVASGLCATLARAAVWKNQPDLVTGRAIASAGLTAVRPFLNAQQRHNAHRDISAEEASYLVVKASQAANP